MEFHANKATEADVIYMGVKGYSILSTLPSLDISFGMVFDAMHCFDIGVFKQLGSLWFDSSFHDEPWYIVTPKIIAAIDLALSEIIPPSNIVRIAQSLNQKALWKSSVWRSFFCILCSLYLEILN